MGIQVMKQAHLWILVVLLTALCVVPPAFAAQKDQCIACHQEIEDPPALKFKNDVHSQMGLSCVSCHGGDSNQEDMELAMDPEKGFMGVPKGKEIMDRCLICHASAEKMKQYGSSINVSPFGDFPQSVHGNPSIATCVSCHEVHEVRRANDPLSPTYPLKEVELCSSCHSNAEFIQKFNRALPTDQFEKYLTSIHGKRWKEGDTKIATCSDCHGAHNVFKHTDPRSSVYALNVPKTCSHCHSNEEYMKEYKIETDQYAKFITSVHGVKLLKDRDTASPACNDCHGNHGATPPGIESISFVCGECHALNAEYFARSPHAEAYREAEIPQCEVCHGNHGVQHPSDKMIQVGQNSVCEECHSEGDTGYETAKQMYTMLKQAENESTQAELLLQKAEQKGMDVTETSFKAKDLPATLIKARTILHTFSLEEFKKEIDTSLVLSQEIAKEGQLAISESAFRRKGLAVSTLFITLLAIALYLKIRKLDSDKKENDSD